MWLLLQGWHNAMIPQFHRFVDAYLHCLHAVHNTGHATSEITDALSVGSHFGETPRATTELLSYGFALTNPRDRLLPPNIKPTSLAFSMANVLWVLRGGSRADEIVFYNKKGQKFASDKGVFEAAFGPRLFGPSEGVNHAIALLKKDSASRRAFVPVYWLSDLTTPTRDVPCLASIQLFVRADRLDMSVHMRSQSAALIMPYDVFLFTAIQELAALRLGVELGVYHHVCGSLHYYEDERATVESILTMNPETGISTPMPPMPRTSDTDLERVLLIEERLRTSAHTATELNLEITKDLSPYWADWIRVLAAYANTAEEKIWSSYIEAGYILQYSAPKL
jgi:thymidylate synthase